MQEVRTRLNVRYVSVYPFPNQLFFQLSVNNSGGKWGSKLYKFMDKNLKFFGHKVA